MKYVKKNRFTTADKRRLSDLEKRVKKFAAENKRSVRLHSKNIQTIKRLLKTLSRKFK